MAKKSMIAKNLRKKGSPVQYRNRCRLCGRPRGYLRRFALCRICFRQLYHEGVIPGVRKASW